LRPRPHPPDPRRRQRRCPTPPTPPSQKTWRPKPPSSRSSPYPSASLRCVLVSWRRMANWILTTGPLRAPETVCCRQTPNPPSSPPRRRLDESNTARRVRPGHGAQGEDLQDNHRCLQYVWTGRPSRGTGLTKRKERHGGITIDTPVFELKGRWPPNANQLLMGDSSANSNQKFSQVHIIRRRGHSSGCC
jgi:hypothetical protein